MNIRFGINSGTVAMEVTNDLARMFAEQKNLTREYTYGRMTTEEFAIDRSRRTLAGINAWFGWETTYTQIIATRISEKTGHGKINIINLNSEEKKNLLNLIEESISLYLNSIPLPDGMPERFIDGKETHEFKTWANKLGSKK